MKKIQSLLWFCVYLITNGSYANNLVLADLVLNTQAQISATVYWENAWYYDSTQIPHNHDAIWLWAKYRQNGIWKTLRFQKNMAVFSQTKIIYQTDVGVLLRRNSVGEGIIQDKITLDLISPIGEDVSDIKLYGVEMVFVPQGSFYVGDSVSQYVLQSHDGSPFFIGSENQIFNLYAKTETNNAHPNRLTAQAPHLPIPARYPKGFQAFYCMKYEISQEQFADFLNTLTYQQQQNHTVSPPNAPVGTPALFDIFSGSSRNDIQIIRPGASPNLPAIYGFSETKNGKNRACNYLNWQNLMAYLDWAGLRPMTELEFEKASQPDKLPLKRGLAHGTADFIRAQTIIDDGTETETVTQMATTAAGVVLSGRAISEQGIQGVLRCGFSARATPNRLQSGTSYWGIFELSGNVWEQVINLSENGVVFEGTHGNGELTLQGFSDALPVNILQEGQGIGLKGGAWNSFIQHNLDYPFRDLAIADRYYIYTMPNRLATVGGRGVLTYQPYE